LEFRAISRVSEAITANRMKIDPAVVEPVGRNANWSLNCSVWVVLVY